MDFVIAFLDSDTPPNIVPRAPVRSVLDILIQSDMEKRAANIILGLKLWMSLKMLTPKLPEMDNKKIPSVYVCPMIFAQEEKRVPLRSVLDILISSDVTKRNTNIIVGLKIWKFCTSLAKKFPAKEKFSPANIEIPKTKLTGMRKCTSVDELPKSKLPTADNLNPVNASASNISDKDRLNEHKKLRTTFVRKRLRDIINPMPAIMEEPKINSNQKPADVVQSESSSDSASGPIEIGGPELGDESEEKSELRWWQRGLRCLRPRRRPRPRPRPRTHGHPQRGSTPASATADADTKRPGWWRRLLLPCCCAEPLAE